MALIIEILDATDRAVRSRVRADTLPLTVGRGWDNDVILEDAYVDARHARVHRDPDGGLCIEDLGSLNGLLVRSADGTDQRQTQAEVGSGTEVRLGRTVLRFRDPTDPVPPAIPDLRGADRSAGHPAPPPGRHALDRPRWRFGLPVAAAAALMLQVSAGTYDPDVSGEVTTALLGLAIISAVWAGGWALTARVALGRFNFGAHLAMISGVVLTALALLAAGDWLIYLVPGVPGGAVVDALLWLGIVAAGIAGHLAFSSRLTAGRRWRAGVITAAVIGGFWLTTSLFTQERFSDVPEFTGVLKPATVRWPAPLETDAFLEAADPLRRAVDELVGG